MPLLLARSPVHDSAKRPDDPLPSVQIGRYRRFYRSELERWPARQRGDAIACGYDVAVARRARGPELLRSAE